MDPISPPTLYTVICYGTLRQACSNHHIIQGSTFLGTGKLIKPATMYSNRSFPILSFTPTSSHSIVVEVYQVDTNTLKRLDQLEGYPQWYARSEEEVHLENGEKIIGWVYHQAFEKHRLQLIVESGDWASR